MRIFDEWVNRAADQGDAIRAKRREYERRGLYISSYKAEILILLDRIRVELSKM